jgi:quercetin dioxygenase-like cupin family protein
MADYTLIEDLGGLAPALTPDSIVSRTFVNREDLKAILFGFAPGQELSEHTASRPAILHFLSGTARLTLGGDPAEARPGTWVYMPPNLPHSVYAETEVSMLLLLID